MTEVEIYLSALNLKPLFVLLVLLGMALCVLDAIITIYRENTLTFLPYRGAFVLICLSLAWDFTYIDNNGWKPWPPLIGVLFALDFLLLMILLRHIEISKIDNRKI